MIKTIRNSDLMRALEETQDNNDISFRENYSGRFMYSSTAWGVVADSPKILAEFELRLAIEITDYDRAYDTIPKWDFIHNAVELADKRYEDNMGYSTIWYYQGIEIDDDE